MAMKLTTGILAIAIMTGAAWAQNPDAIDNARSVAKSLQQKQADDSNAAAGVPATAKPAPGAPAPAVKPAVIPASKPASTTVSNTAQPAKSSTAASAVKSSTAPAAKQKAAATKPAVVVAKPVVVAKAPAKTPAPKSVAKAAEASKKQAAAAKGAGKTIKTTEAIPVAAPTAKPAEAPASADASKQPKPEDKKWAMNGKRDPFFSPVVQQQGGSNCSTGKKCLEIGQINLRGVVKSDNGFIAVVTNNLNKAYFLRENDPVFNGYVVKITGDSVVFQETVQDKLGKPFTREVVKRIFTPAV
jgi:Tfp pilus assembly protein PilP